MCLTDTQLEMFYIPEILLCVRQPVLGVYTCGSVLLELDMLLGGKSCMTVLSTFLFGIDLLSCVYMYAQQGYVFGYVGLCECVCQ